MDFFRDVCRTRHRQIFFLVVSGLLQAAIFIYSALLLGVGLYILLIVTDKIGPILDENDENLSIGISMELLSGFIACIGLCNAFVCTAYPCAIYTVLNLEGNKLHRKKIVSFALSQVVLGFGILCIGVLCLLQRIRLNGNLSAAIMNTLSHYRSRMELKTSIDKMQIYYQCCGGKGLSDWSEIDWYRTKSSVQDSVNDAPFSCCNRFSMSHCLTKTDVYTMNIVLKSPLRDIWYTRGCTGVVIESFSRSLLLPVGIVSIIFFVLQMFGTYLSCLVLSLLNEKRPKRKCQKLHFDMENFIHDNCHHGQVGYECSSSSDDQMPFYSRATLQALLRNQKVNHNLFAKEKHCKESMSLKKEEIKYPITAPIVYDHEDDDDEEDGYASLNMNVNNGRRAGYGSAARNIANYYEAVPIEGFYNRIETMAEDDIGARHNAVDEESYNVARDAALRAMLETDAIDERVDTEPRYDERHVKW